MSLFYSLDFDELTENGHVLWLLLTKLKYKMKHRLNLKRGIILSVFPLLASACSNHSFEGNEVPDSSNLPLKIAGDIRTRVADNRFESGDEVGLFALVESTTLKEERYVDNMRFVYSSDGEFVSEETVYYPDDNVKLNLLSYYPYQKEGIETGASAMPVQTEADLSIPGNLSKSDFLIASLNSVAASKEPVGLTYNHKFFRLKVSIAPGEGESTDELLRSNPKLSARGFYRKAIYDFQKDDYSAYSAEEEITAAGKWEIQGGRLVGKEFILIPQNIENGHQYLILSVNGRDYVSRLSSSLEVKSGKQREIQIAFTSNEDILINHLNGEIADWQNEGKEDVSPEPVHNYIDVSELTFEQSNVYKVLSAGKQVAEICKEYLVARDGFTSQAIVAYPVKEDNVDLSAGKVLKCLGHKENVHGGTVSWNMDTHALTYVPGKLSARNYLFVLSDGKIALSLSRADKPLPVLALSDVIRDVRGSVIRNYPIVKIGTQYWMRSNLETSLYNDGSQIVKLDTVASGDMGYLSSASGSCFYSMKTIYSQNLLPSGWQMPDWNDWDILKTYLNNDASALKSGDWLPVKEGNTVYGANNLSGFNALPIGMAWRRYQKEYEGKYVSYWTLDGKGTAADAQVFLLQSGKNELDRGKMGEDKAYAIRCIRK